MGNTLKWLFRSNAKVKLSTNQPKREERQCGKWAIEDLREFALTLYFASLKYIFGYLLTDHSIH